MDVGVIGYSNSSIPVGRIPLLPLASDRPLPRWILWGTFGLIIFLYALLWTPHWYPLSDSSLYLVMARGLMQGRGYGYLRLVHHDVRPLTPLLLYAILKLGGGIGAMQAVLSALTLLSHTLAFLTLRRWFNERIALLSVIATAASWWVYANAFTIMTEPFFLVMFWACLLTLSYLPNGSTGRQWLLVIFASLFMLGAFENRIAALLLIPGTIFGLWMQNRDVNWGTRLGWVMVFVVVFALALLEWRRPFSAPIPGQSGATGGVMGSAEGEAAGPEAYHLTALVNITNPFVQLPVSAGRWVTEGLAMVTAYPFDPHRPLWMQAIAGVGVFALFLITCAGWFRLIRGRQWYAIGMAAYFFPYWIMWGNRLKPRYMTPILPLIFIQLWAGLALLLWWWRRRRLESGDDAHAAWHRIATGVGLFALSLLLICNAFPYGVDFYVRHVSKLDFYDVARRGAFAELVDVGAYLERNTPSDAQIWMNYGPNRRVLGLLSDRDFRLPIPIKKRAGADIIIHDPSDRRNLNAYFASILSADPRAEWAIVFYDQYSWPGYHLPIVRDARTATDPPRWWQLFHRERRIFVPVTVPIQKDRLQTLPGLNSKSAAP